jgi:hypothetical protein
MSEQLIADLKAARAEIVARGRCSFDLVNEYGSVCMLGAVGVAALGNTFLGNPGYEWFEDSPRLRSVEDVLLKYVPKTHKNFPIEAFNDDETTTDADVLTVFDKALADLGGLA